MSKIIPKNSYKVKTTIIKDGELIIQGLPFKQGDTVDLTLTKDNVKRHLTCGDILTMPIVGLWAERDDISDTLDFADHIRNEIVKRNSK
jgi:hypothetical protein